MKIKRKKERKQDSRDLKTLMQKFAAFKYDILNYKNESNVSKERY